VAGGGPATGAGGTRRGSRWSAGRPAVDLRWLRGGLTGSAGGVRTRSGGRCGWAFRVPRRTTIVHSNGW